MVLLFSGLVKLKYSKFTVSLTDCSDIFFLEVWLFLPLPCVRSLNNPEEILFRQMMQPVAWRQKQQVVGRKWKKYSSTKEVMYLCVLCTVPVHAGEISPEVSCSVSGTDFDRVNKNRVTLQKKVKFLISPDRCSWTENEKIIHRSVIITSRNLQMSDLSLELMKTTFSNNQKNGRFSSSLGFSRVRMR